MIHYKSIVGDNKPKINPPPNTNIITSHKSITQSIITISFEIISLFYSEKLHIFKHNYVYLNYPMELTEKGNLDQAMISSPQDKLLTVNTNTILNY